MHGISHHGPFANERVFNMLRHNGEVSSQFPKTEWVSLGRLSTEKRWWYGEHVSRPMMCAQTVTGNAITSHRNETISKRLTQHNIAIKWELVFRLRRPESSIDGRKFDLNIGWTSHSLNICCVNENAAQQMCPYYGHEDGTMKSEMGITHRWYAFTIMSNLETDICSVRLYECGYAARVYSLRSSERNRKIFY